MNYQAQIENLDREQKSVRLARKELSCPNRESWRTLAEICLARVGKSLDDAQRGRQKFSPNFRPQAEG